MDTGISLRWRIAGTALFASATSLLSFPAAAEILDAKAARNLVSDRQWQQLRRTGVGYIYWSWKSDGSACVRLDTRTGECFDTGQWKLDGDRFCFEVKSYMKTEKANAACLRISDKGKGRYEALQDNGLTFFEFSVVE